MARRLSPFIGSMVIDNQDVGLRGEIAALGLNVAVTDTIMRDPTVSAKLADVVILTGIGATGE